MSAPVPAAAQEWFVRCAADNSRAFWAREKALHERDVRRPLLALLAASGEDPAQWKVHRPHRDTRFGGAAAGPLKESLGALRVDPDGTGRYVQVDRRGLLASSGLPYLAPDQLPRWRSAVADDAGRALEDVLRDAEARGCRRKSGYPEPLKRAPRGTDPDHPRIELLRWKGVELYARLPLGGGDDQVSWLTGTWDAGRPLCAWLAAHVGPSALERPRGR